MLVEETQVTRRPEAKLREWRDVAPEVATRKVLRPPFKAVCDGAPVMLAVDSGLPADLLFNTFDRIDYASSDRSGGMVTRSRTFGFNPRNAVRRDYCSVSALHREAPKVWGLLQESAKQVAEVYKHLLPDQFAHHEKAVATTQNTWRIPHTPFTSGIINQSATLPYHRDRGNHEGVWSAMVVVRKQTEGGELVLPELDIAVDLPNGTLVLFDGQKWLHGVAPIVKTQLSGRRYSCVFYSLKQLWHCLTPEEELRRFRSEKTRKERGRVT